MNEVIMIRCGTDCDGKSLYRLTVDGREVTPRLTLAEAVSVLREVDKRRAET